MAEEKNEWNNFLPGLFGWLGSNDKMLFSELQEEVLHIVPIESIEKNEKVRVTSANIPLPEKNIIEKTAVSFGWAYGGEPFAVVANNYHFLLVSQTNIKAHSSQIGRDVGIRAAKYLQAMKVSKVVCTGNSSVNAYDVWEGLIQGLFKYTAFKSRKTENVIPNFVGLLSDSEHSLQVKKSIALAQSAIFSRSLGEAPPSWLNSEVLGDLVEDVFSDRAGVKVSVKGKNEIKSLGMGAFSSVASGTSIDPKLILVEIEGKDQSKKIALVGKGLTFDSGGISLKRPQGMEQMKYDMCGGAAVIGAAHYFSKVKPPCNVVCIVGAVENMPFDKATRPGDVVTAKNGKTIEVINTDAEGRLVLADLLTYAVETYSPEFVIDIATLTGAIIVALGHTGCGLMSNSEALVEHIIKASKDAGEPLWHLPIWEEYDNKIKSSVADIKNITADSVGGKSLSAASFLKQFVGSTKWAHLDIAGTAWDCDATGFPSKGASAYGLRTLVYSCENIPSSSF